MVRGDQPITDTSSPASQFKARFQQQWPIEKTFTFFRIQNFHASQLEPGVQHD
jgi:hypothetical protein